MISKSVERAQKKVEENNFAIRKRLLEYDNTMNSQREVIYARRQKALQGDRLKSEILSQMEEIVEEIVEKNFESVNVIGIKEQILQALLVDVRLEPEEFETLGKDGIVKRIIDAANDFYKRKEEMLGSELMARLERYAVLSVLDHKWKEHLREMDDLKEGIGLRAYGQKDPLVEYKTEAFKIFVELLDQIKYESVSFAFKFWPQAPEEVQRRRTTPLRMMERKQSTENIGLTSRPPQTSADGKVQTVHVEDKVGRNDPCPCGSGKKYKHCHGK
jgi:preprotein translocase subunit SecA